MKVLGERQGDPGTHKNKTETFYPVCLSVMAETETDKSLCQCIILLGPKGLVRFSNISNKKSLTMKLGQNKSAWLFEALGRQVEGLISQNKY